LPSGSINEQFDIRELKGSTHQFDLPFAIIVDEDYRLDRLWTEIVVLFLRKVV
jgi:hypothetical protein